MSRTESTMVQLGTIAPAFELTDVLTGRAMSRDDVFALSWDDNLSDAANAAVTGGPPHKHGPLVMFLCVHSPAAPTAWATTPPSPAATSAPPSTPSSPASAPTPTSAPPSAATSSGAKPD